MSKLLEPAFSSPHGAIIRPEGGYGITLAAGFGTPAGVPLPSAGYAPGCIYQDLTNHVLYRNDGSVTASSWTKLVGVGDTVASLTVTSLTTSGVVRTSQTYQLGRGGTAKAGTTAGWTVNAGNNIGTIATVAASQTSSTLVVAVPNLHVGDTITGFSVYSSINSAGGAVTLDANLRTLTIAAGATATDASVASITQVSVSAATASTATKSGLSTTVTAGVNYYLLLTATTAGSTTIELDQVEVTVTSA